MLTKLTAALLAMLLMALAQPTLAHNHSASLRLTGVVHPNVSVALANVSLNLSDGQVSISITERSNSAAGYKLLLVDQRGGVHHLSATDEAKKARSRPLVLLKPAVGNNVAQVVTLIVRSN
jgi:hypothetical protein